MIWYIDFVKNVDVWFVESRVVIFGREWFEVFISVWGGYILEIYGVFVVLCSMYDNDVEVEEVWNDWM